MWSRAGDPAAPGRREVIDRAAALVGRVLAGLAGASSDEDVLARLAGLLADCGSRLDSQAVLFLATHHPRVAAQLCRDDPEFARGSRPGRRRVSYGDMLSDYLRRHSPGRQFADVEPRCLVLGRCWVCDRCQMHMFPGVREWIVWLALAPVWRGLAGAPAVHPAVEDMERQSPRPPPEPGRQHGTVLVVVELASADLAGELAGAWRRDTDGPGPTPDLVARFTGAALAAEFFQDPAARNLMIAARFRL